MIITSRTLSNQISKSRAPTSSTNSKNRSKKTFSSNSGKHAIGKRTTVSTRIQGIILFRSGDDLTCQFAHLQRRQQYGGLGTMATTGCSRKPTRSTRRRVKRSITYSAEASELQDKPAMLRDASERSFLKNYHF